MSFCHFVIVIFCRGCLRHLVPAVMAGLADPAVTLVEAHHIDYLTTSQNNDTTNIIIISPNYHRIIHKNNPVFNRKKFVLPTFAR